MDVERSEGDEPSAVWGRIAERHPIQGEYEVAVLAHRPARESGGDIGERLDPLETHTSRVKS